MNREFLIKRIEEVEKQINDLCIKKFVYQDILENDIDCQVKDKITSRCEEESIKRVVSKASREKLTAKGRRPHPDSFATKMIKILEQSERPLHVEEIKETLHKNEADKGISVGDIGKTLSAYASRKTRDIVRVASNTYTIMP